jgi:Rod binding domain-containing protein
MSVELKPTTPNILAGSGLLSRLEGKKSLSEKEKDKVLTEFESFFLFTMLKELEKTTQVTKKGGNTQQTYMAIVYEKMGDFLAKKGIGIKEAIKRYIDGGSPKVMPPSGDNKDK